MNRQTPQAPLEEPGLATRRARFQVVGGDGRRSDVDWVAVEEPLALSIGGVRLGVLMRTPGHDLELGLGFALTEGLVGSPGDLVRIHHVDDEENVLVLVPRADASFDLAFARRNLITSSSCGLCGCLTVEQVRRAAPRSPVRHSFSARMLQGLPTALRDHQPAFASTGGHHAAALVDPLGDFVVVREDIGRHNAVDKVVGAACGMGRCPSDCLLLVSGRCSLEIVQKAMMVGIGTVVALGAASSLAIDLAHQAGMTLVAFASPQKLCVYTGEEYIDVGRAS